MKGFLFQIGSPDIPRIGTRVRSCSRPWWGVGVAFDRDDKLAIRWEGRFLSTDLRPDVLRELDLVEASEYGP